MSTGLLRLVYISTASAAIDRGSLDAILTNASAKNPADGITGVLCASRDHYLQVLEGPVRPVLSLYLRIMADPRHHDPTLLSISLVAGRLFDQWAMAYIDGRAHGALAREVLLAANDPETRGDRASAILRRFVAELKHASPSTADAAGAR